MKILSIETSCDETSVAIIKTDNKKPGKNIFPDFSVLAHVTHTQIETHQKTGGVVPEVAAREHVEKIIPVIDEALKNAKLQNKKKPVDVIAVTGGPGLVTSLTIGVEAAKTLSLAWQVPIIDVHHIEGHIFAGFAQKKSQKIQFPILALVVSGGHTEILLMKKWGKYIRIGKTRDDAAGEAFDKIAKLLDLGYPGGPAVSREAEKGDSASIDFPRPMIRDRNFDFSFSGLKTAVLYHVKESDLYNTKKSAEQRKRDIQNICASFEEATCDVLVTKTIKAAKKYKVKSIVLAGGVSANKRLRAKLQKEAEGNDIGFIVPEFNLCMDNALMIALAAIHKTQKEEYSELTDVRANPQKELVK